MLKKVFGLILLGLLILCLGYFNKTVYRSIKNQPYSFIIYYDYLARNMDCLFNVQRWKEKVDPDTLVQGQFIKLSNAPFILIYPWQGEKVMRCAWRYNWLANGNIFLKVNGRTVGISQNYYEKLKYDIKKLRHPENILIYIGNRLPDYLRQCTNLQLVLFKEGDIGVLENASELRILETYEGSTEKEFEIIGNFSNLEVLVVCPNRARDEGLEVLSELTNLKQLYVKGGRLTGEGFKNWDKLKNLKKLQLANLVFPDQAYQYIAEIPNLTHLQIQWASLTDKGLEYVSEMKSLTHLYIYSDHITDEGLRYLARLPNLTHLTIAGDSITDQGRAFLKTFDNLERLRIDEFSLLYWEQSF